MSGMDRYAEFVGDYWKSKIKEGRKMSEVRKIPTREEFLDAVTGSIRHHLKGAGQSKEDYRRFSLSGDSCGLCVLNNKFRESLSCDDCVLHVGTALECCEEYAKVKYQRDVGAHKGFVNAEIAMVRRLSELLDPKVYDEFYPKVEAKVKELSLRDRIKPFTRKSENGTRVLFIEWVSDDTDLTVHWVDNESDYNWDYIRKSWIVPILRIAGIRIMPSEKLGPEVDRYDMAEVMVDKKEAFKK